MGDVTFDFDGDTVVVTGGASGIGRAIAIRFGGAGATVIVADVQRDPKDVDAERPTHEVVEARGGEARFVDADVSDPHDVEAVVEAARGFGGVDVMVNNAAVYSGGDLFELTPSELDRLYETNVRGTMFGVRTAAMDMVDRGDPGTIVNVASISASYAQHDQVQYDATKGAIRMITRGAALDLADEGIRVNAVAPGQIATEIADGWTEESREKAAADEFIKPVPLGRAGEPADVAGAVCYLASDAAAYVTGEMHYVDGGWQTC